MLMMCHLSCGGGVAGALYNCALGAARERCLPRMTAHASRLLRPFLERRGWSLVAREQVDRNGIQIERFEMLLALDGD